MAVKKRTALTVEDLKASTSRGGSVVRGIQTAVGTEVLSVPVEQIAPSPFNPPERSVPDPGLAESVATLGVLSPLLLVPVEDWVAAHGPLDVDEQVRYVSVAGHRRLAAAVAAELVDVPGILRPDMAAQAVEVMLGENSNRLSLSPWEEALGFQRLVDKGMTQSQIAKVQGVAQGQVAKRLKLLQLPTGIASLVSGRGGSFGVTEALQLLEDGTEEELAALAEVFVAPDPDAWQTRPREQLSKIRRQLRDEALAAEAAQLAADLGVEVVDPRTKFGNNDWNHTLTTKAEIAKHRKAGTLVVGVHYNEVTHFSTEPSPYQLAERQAAAAKKRRFTFVAEQLAAKTFPIKGSQETVIRRVLSGVGVDSNAVTVAARWAVAAGLIAEEAAWGKHQAVPQVSMAVAVKLVNLLELAEDHQFINSYSRFSKDAVDLYRLLTSLGYEPDEWELEKLGNQLNTNTEEEGGL